MLVGPAFRREAPVAVRWQRAAPRHAASLYALATGCALVTSCSRGGLLDGAATGAGSSAGGATPSSSTTGSGAHGGTGSDTGPGATGGTGGAVPTCISYPGVCLQCLAHDCPIKWCDCVDDGACLALFQCWQDCAGVASCNAACQSAHPSGIAPAYLLGDCAATTCDAQCTWGQDLKPCAECLFNACAAAADDCLASPSCLPLYQCLQACAPADAGCQQQCYADHGDGVVTLEPLLQCAQQQCPSPCAP